MGNQLLKGICPKCGLPYAGRPALSRDDNKTLICPDCGVREALESIGVDAAEQEEMGLPDRPSATDDVPLRCGGAVRLRLLRKRNIAFSGTAAFTTSQASTIRITSGSH